MRDGLLFLHIVGVAGWVGGGLFAFFTVSSLARSGSTGAGAAIKTIIGGSDRYFVTMLVLVLLTGIGLVMTSDAYRWTDTFVLVGIAAFAMSGIWQGVSKKSKERLINSIASEGSELTAALPGLRRNIYVDIGIAVLALWAMVDKPGF